jgi:hypothetical protein
VDPTRETIRRLHRFHEGLLGIAERVERTLFVIDAVTGRPVFPAPPGAVEEESITLHIPEDEPGSVQILGRAVEVDPLRDEACDRWLFYHGRPRWAHWAAIEIESLKNVETVLDHDEVQIANPLRPFEPAICKWVNQNAAALAAACERSLGTHPESPLLVGVDPYGLDVRAHFGVMRLEFEGTCDDEAEAREALKRMLQL